MEISYFLIPDIWHNTLYFQNNKLLCSNPLNYPYEKNPVFLMICLLLSLPFKATEMKQYAFQQIINIQNGLSSSVRCLTVSHEKDMCG